MTDSEQILEMLDEETRKKAEVMLEKLIDLQKMVLCCSIAYYQFNDNLTSDYNYDRWGLELQHIMRHFPIADLSPLHYAFHDYTGGTKSGFDLVGRLTEEDWQKYAWITQQMLKDRHERLELL